MSTGCHYFSFGWFQYMVVYIIAAADNSRVTTVNGAFPGVLDESMSTNNIHKTL